MDWQAFTADPLAFVPLAVAALTTGIGVGAVCVLVTLVYRRRR